ncbi:MAG: serine/threonine-protein kinase [Candidatus Sulfopaludibacter sp.]|nr:serine/threonine-protein kinase [Candidatus Sulfopaludibacter sp.]
MARDSRTDQEACPTRVGRYEIVRRLGRSMTDVYLAIDTVENRRAALKLVKTGGDRASRLIMEAERRGAEIQRAVQMLDARVVEIYDVGDEDGYFFVAMQYVEGRNVAEILRQDHVIEPMRAAVVALEICEQLAKFHSWQSTVVHGDIKPSNILLGANDTVRLLDFGIAKMLRSDGSATAHNFGSPSYCSPERLTHSEVDRQSDLWAVGATLYEMLSGMPPYQAGDTRRLESLIRSKRPPRALPPSCPRALQLIAMKALAPDPGKRYLTAAEFQGDLQAFLEAKPTMAERERQGWNPNATIEAAREALRKATRTVKRANQRWRLLGAVGWFAAGMALWIGGAVGWEQLQARNAAVLKPAPPKPSAEWRQIYLDEANTALQASDWQKAEICLQRAVQLGGSDDLTLGRLALVRGYLELERLDDGGNSAAAAAQWSAAARDRFQEAARRMPREAAPHLALARIYVYWLPNVERAMAEFHAAGQLGAPTGQREIEQQGDAYRLEALREAASAPQTAWQDAGMARQIYQRVRGFDRVEQSLKELETVKAPRPRHRAIRRPIQRRRIWR